VCPYDHRQTRLCVAALIVRVRGAER
jgi:hypothetical protein